MNFKLWLLPPHVSQPGLVIFLQVGWVIMIVARLSENDTSKLCSRQHYTDSEVRQVATLSKNLISLNTCVGDAVLLLKVESEGASQ